MKKGLAQETVYLSKKELGPKIMQVLTKSHYKFLGPRYLPVLRLIPRIYDVLK